MSDDVKRLRALAFVQREGATNLRAMQQIYGRADRARWASENDADAAALDRAAACVEREERARKAAPLTINVASSTGDEPFASIFDDRGKRAIVVTGTRTDLADRLRATALALEEK